MEFDNLMTLNMTGISQNEGFARVSVAAFVSQLDPTVSEITDIKTAVSEAVTNAIIHGYGEACEKGTVTLKCAVKANTVYIEVSDTGEGIEDITQARLPLYTSKPHMERSGMGFTVMETFMDSVEVESVPQKGTTIRMTKKIGDEQKSQS